MLAWGIQRFTPPLTPPIIDYVNEEYKKNTEIESGKLRAEMLAEFKLKKMTGSAGTYVNPKCN